MLITANRSAYVVRETAWPAHTSAPFGTHATGPANASTTPQSRRAADSRCAADAPDGPVPDCASWISDVVIEVVALVNGPTTASSSAEAGVDGTVGDVAAVPATRSMVAFRPADPPSSGSFIFSTTRS